MASSHSTWSASVCTGVFLLAAAGLITGRTVTTHWGRAGELARQHPAEYRTRFRSTRELT